jgi:hypothetical protein
VRYLNGVDLAPRPLRGRCQVLKELLVDLGPGPRGGYEAGRLSVIEKPLAGSRRALR